MRARARCGLGRPGAARTRTAAVPEPGLRAEPEAGPRAEPAPRASGRARDVRGPASPRVGGVGAAGQRRPRKAPSGRENPQRSPAAAKTLAGGCRGPYPYSESSQPHRSTVRHAAGAAPGHTLRIPAPGRRRHEPIRFRAPREAWKRMHTFSRPRPRAIANCFALLRAGLDAVRTRSHSPRRRGHLRSWSREGWQGGDTRTSARTERQIGRNGELRPAYMELDLTAKRPASHGPVVLWTRRSLGSITAVRRPVLSNWNPTTRLLRFGAGRSELL